MVCQHANLLSVAEFSTTFRSFPSLWIYCLIRDRHQNGLADAVIKIRGKWFIDVDKFFQWVESQRTYLHEVSHEATPGICV